MTTITETAAPPATAPPAAPAQEVLPVTEQSAPNDAEEGEAPAAGGAAPSEDDSSGPGTVAPRETGANTPAKANALPFTGGLVLPIAGAGLLLLGAGALLRRRTVG